MDYLLKRRILLLASAATPLALVVGKYATPKRDTESTTKSVPLEDLEYDVGGRLGVYLFDSATGKQVRHRASERFPLCSTYKVMLGAAVLARSVERPALLCQRMTYGQAEISGAGYTPVTQKHISTGMTVTELCAAAIQDSDDAAANLLVRLMGGPSEVNAFARSIGDVDFRLDRYEQELNTAVPNDLRDTTTPFAMANSLRVLVLGNALRAHQRAQLVGWLGNCTKTGTGDYGTTNDIAVLWPSGGGGPMVLSVYYTQARPDAKAKDKVVALATHAALEALWNE
jgi:beta-lactamase class A